MIYYCLENPQIYDPELKDCLCHNAKENKIYQQDPKIGCIGDFTDIADVMKFWIKVQD